MAKRANIEIRNGTPLAIHNDEELAERTSALFALTQKVASSPEEDEAIEQLTRQIEEYESRHFPVVAAGNSLA